MYSLNGMKCIQVSNWLAQLCYSNVAGKKMACNSHCLACLLVCFAEVMLLVVACNLLCWACGVTLHIAKLKLIRYSSCDHTYSCSQRKIDNKLECGLFHLLCVSADSNCPRIMREEVIRGCNLDVLAWDESEEAEVAINFVLDLVFLFPEELRQQMERGLQNC